VFEKHTHQEEQAWDIFRETFGPKWGEQRKEITDEIKALAYSCHPFKLVPSTDGITKKRRGEFEKYGYCSSSACHSLRILRQATELMNTGVMTFPRPDAEELVKIKTGDCTLDEFKVIYEKAKVEADVAYKETKLPEKVDRERVVKWLEEQITIGITRDSRFDDFRAGYMSYEWFKALGCDPKLLRYGFEQERVEDGIGPCIVNADGLKRVDFT
jgi:hypothetical protein